MPRRPATRTAAAGRQLAALFPADPWTGGGLGITADEDGAQLDLLEEVQALELRRLDKGPCPFTPCPLQADHAGNCTPADWRDTCTGYKVPEHAHPAAELRPSFLCPPCDARLSADVAAQDRPAAPARCIGGDHAPGARYWDCLACYAD